VDSLKFINFLGICCDIRLDQSPSQVIKPGDSVKLSCKTSEFNMTSYYMHWIRQKPGKGLEWIGNSLKGQFTLTEDVPTSTQFLEAKNLRAEDTAVYYCINHYHCDYYFDYWGKGTEVTVTSATATAPTLFPLAQCGSGPRDMLTLGCMATGFTPPSITFKWKDSTKTALTDFIQYPSVQSNGKYMGVSQLSIKKADWDTKDFVCAVEHSAVPPPPISPSLYVMTPSKEEIKDNQTASFACLASGFSPKEYKITWLKNNKPISEEVTDFCQDEQKGQGTTLYSATSFLKVNESDWTDLSEYTCQFEHKTGTQTKTGDECVKYDLEFKFTEPTSEDILEEEIPITCEVKAKEKGFASIKWMKEDNTVIYEDKGEHLKNTFTVSAQIRITKDEWIKRTLFICSVEHKDLPGSDQETYQRNNDPKPPSIKLLRPSESDLLESENVTLLCLVSGFFPSDVIVKWKHDGSDLPSSRYSNGPSVQYAGSSTYYMNSRLVVPKAESYQNSNYSCVVRHESSDTPIERTIDQVFGKTFDICIINIILKCPSVNLLWFLDKMWSYTTCKNLGPHRQLLQKSARFH
uniref:Ig-like domain-containing protein n=1 Tax=Esox lucius TaxID=8010 RepID=A0A6Q2YVP1_ESOLU